MDKSASLIKAVFRDADMLVSAYMDGKVRLFVPLHTSHQGLA